MIGHNATVEINGTSEFKGSESYKGSGSGDVIRDDEDYVEGSGDVDDEDFNQELGSGEENLQQPPTIPEITIPTKISRLFYCQENK